MRKRLLLLLLTTWTITAFASDPQIPQSGSPYNSYRPTSTVHDGELYVFTNPYTFVHTAGATWSAPETFPLGTHTNCFTIPSGVSFNGKLYVFVECSSVLYTSRDASGTWSAVSSIPGAQAGATVGLAVYNNRLYAMWRAWPTNTSLFYASMGTDGVWSSTARLSTGESGASPTAAVLTGSDGVNYLYAFWCDRYAEGNSQGMFYSRMGPSGTWSSAQRLNTPDYPLTTHAPATGATPTELVIAYKGSHNDNLLYKKMSSSLQWANEVDTGWDVTATAPSLAYFNGQVWLIYRYKYIQNGGVYFVRYQIVN